MKAGTYNYKLKGGKDYLLHGDHGRMSGEEKEKLDTPILQRP